MEIPQRNAMENSGKQNPKIGFTPARAEIPKYKWLSLKSLRSMAEMPFPASNRPSSEARYTGKKDHWITDYG
jgi:hypothetical protein